MHWAVQALLIPLTFAQHCLSSLAALSFTSGAYFLYNGRW